MVKKIMWSWMLVFSILLFMISGCKSNTAEPEKRCNAFMASYIEIPEGIIYVGDVVATSEHIVISALSANADGVYEPQLLWVNLDASICKIQKLNLSYPPNLFSNGEHVYMCFRDSDIGFTVQKIGIEERVDIGQNMNVAWYDDFAVLEDIVAFIDDVGNVTCFKEGENVFSLPTSTPGDINRKQLFVYGQKMVIADSFASKLFLFDPSGRTEETAIMDISEQQTLTGLPCISDYGIFFSNTPSSILQIDPQDGTTKEYLSFFDTDIPPCSSGRYAHREPIVLDENRVIKVYEAAEEISPEIVLLSRLSENPHADKTILTIGGVGADYDPLIELAVYFFNISQSDYRIRIREYAYLYPFSGPEEYERVLATLISDMSSGTTDDILMGSVFFNYEKMGKNGAVIDMMPFLEKEKELTEEAWIQSILNLMKTESAMYRFFPGFTFFGYFGNAEYLEKKTIYSVPEMMRLADSLPEGVRMFQLVLPENLFASAVIYGLDEYIDETGAFRISEEQVQQLIDYANQFGITFGEEELMHTSHHEYIRGKEATTLGFVWSAQNYREIENLIDAPTTFVGSPTLKGSAGICSPSTSVAISSGSKHPEACWEFIKILMSPEMQQKVTEQGMFPVSQSAYETYIDKAIHPEKRLSAEEQTFMTNDRSPVSVECAERLTSIIASLNTTNETDMLFVEMILEELPSALNGSKTAAETANILSDRLNLYLQTNSLIIS